MSSQEVIKTVSQKLKYYFEVKRLEDGFDLSGPYSPTLDHPPLKARSTLQYDGLHDRPVKHYFSPHNVRVQLTKMKCPDGKRAREGQVKNLVRQYMDDSNFVHPTMPEYSYYHTPKGRRLKAEYQGHGTSTLRRKKKPYKGGYPLLRSVAPHTISKGEAVRLVNAATKLLVATETIDMKDGKGSSRSSSSSSQLPRLRSRPATAKYSYDINGRRVRVERKGGVTISHDFYDHLPQISSHYIIPVQDDDNCKDDSYLMDEADSAYSTRQTSSPMTGFTPGSKAMPNWLRKEIQKLDRKNAQGIENQYVRPESGSMEAISSPRRDRPMSAKGERRRTYDLTASSTGEWPQTTEDACVQTEGKSVVHDEVPERIVTSGDMAKYRVYVKTGNKLGASTTADVFITLYGTYGRTEEILLHESKRHKCKFVKGQEDEFHFQYFHVGDIKRIQIGHNRTELGSGWYLDTVSVNDLLERVSYRFRCGRWLSYRDEDCKTKRFFEVDTMRNIPEDSELTETESTYSTSSRSRSSSSSYSDSESEHTSVQVQQSQKDDSPKRHVISVSSSYGSSESDKDGTQVIDVSSSIKNDDDRPRSQPSTPSKSSYTKTSKGDDFSSNKAQASSRSAPKGSGEDDRDAPVIRPVEAPTLHMKEKSGARKGRGDENYRAGMKATKRSDDEKSQDRLGQGDCVHKASTTGDLKRVTVLVNRNPDLINAKDERGSTPLHLASAYGQVEVVKWLAINCADLNAETPTGYTPVHVAALNGHLNCVMVLSAMGASVDAQSVDQQTPLHLAAISGRFEVCQWLVANKADISAQDNMDRTPLDLAREYRHGKVAEFLQTWKDESRNPRSGSSMLRSGEQMDGDKKDSSSIGTSSSRKAEASRSYEKEDYRLRRSSESSQHSDDSDYTPRIDPGTDTTEADLTEQMKQKKKEELEEKRKQYAEQKKKMESTHTSFLDSIRDEALGDD